MNVIESPDITTVDYEQLPDEDTRDIDMTLALMRKIQDMLLILNNKSSLSHDTVASLESIRPGTVIDNPYFDDVNIFSQQGYQVALEYLIVQDIKLISSLTLKASKNFARGASYIVKNISKGISRVNEYKQLSKTYDTKELLTSKSFNLPDGVLDSVKELDLNKQRRLAKATAAFTGFSVNNQSGIQKVMSALTKSKNGLMLMTSLPLPKYDKLILELHTKPSAVNRDMLGFTRVLSSSIVPHIVYNFDNLFSQISSAVDSGDFAKMVSVDVDLFPVEIKKPIEQLGDRLDVQHNSNYKTYLNNLYKTTKPLFKTVQDKDKIKSAAPDCQSNLQDLDEMAKNCIKAVSNLSAINSKNENKIKQTIDKLHQLKDSQTLRSKIKNSKSVNAVSKQNYMQALNQLQQTAHFINFIIRLNDSVLAAHYQCFNELHKLNKDTTKYLNTVNKLQGK